MMAVMLLLQVARQFLLMQPIENALNTGNYLNFRLICQHHVSINCGAPLDFHGYINVEEFIRTFSNLMADFGVKEKEWISQQIEEKLAVQSLHLVLRSDKADDPIYYKFIFFMNLEEYAVEQISAEFSEIFYLDDPHWPEGAEFEIFGSTAGVNDGQYKITGKKGQVYQVIRIDSNKKIKSEKWKNLRAKAWKLYFIRGLRM